MYRYETHLHTAISSACSRFQPQEIVEKYVRLNYRGVFVTDHFLNGNTSVPKDLPWKERIARYAEGYERVKKAAEGRLDVFFGFESSYKGSDFLVYGLSPAWLSEHPEIMDMKTSDMCLFFRQEGALVIQAHPYREASYINHIRLYPQYIDGIETVNANMSERGNRLADVLADSYELKKTGGSDIHTVTLNHLAGVEFESRVLSERDYKDKILRGEGKIFTLTDEAYL